MTELTAHFDDDAWQSFVRGILPASLEQAMRAHLDGGCTGCQRSHEIWKRVVETAGRNEPFSADALANAVFAFRQRIPFRAGLALLAERVFDSFLDRVLVGIRVSASAAARQLVYEAGGYLIDLQFEHLAGGRGALTGQVVHAWSEGATRGAGVVLLREDSVVGQTVANSIGEFQLDCEYWDNLKICLGLEDETFIEVLLPDTGPRVVGSKRQWRDQR
jgi:hypothetical protein